MPLPLRYLLLLPLLVLSMSFKEARTAEVTIKTFFYCDHFDSCESKAALEKDIAFAKGVKLVSIDAQAMTIRVTYNPKKTDPQQIRQAISKAGYDADDVKADPQAQEKLDACCRKK